MTNAAALTAIAVGVAGMLGILLRMTFQLGALVAEFRAYVKSNDADIVSLGQRVTRVESRRR
jgi:hypothetical protein